MGAARRVDGSATTFSVYPLVFFTINESFLRVPTLRAFAPTLWEPPSLACPIRRANLAAFARHFPKVSLSIKSSDTPLDLIREGIDVAIRMGFLKDSSLKLKRLYDVERKLVAASAYASARRQPVKSKDLVAWDWLRLKSRPPRAEFMSRASRRQQIEFSPRVVVDSAQSMLELARHGLGLAMVPAFLAEPDLRKGRIVEVLADWALDAPGVYAVSPPNAPRSGLTMRFVTFLEKRIGRSSRNSPRHG